MTVKVIVTVMFFFNGIDFAEEQMPDGTVVDIDECKLIKKCNELLEKIPSELTPTDDTSDFQAFANAIVLEEDGVDII
jgi:hypothetical protein